MVLRTVYLPPDLDDKLRVKAFRDGVAKGDIIRQALEKELADMPGFGRDAVERKKPARKARGRTAAAGGA